MLQAAEESERRSNYVEECANVDDIVQAVKIGGDEKTTENPLSVGGLPSSSLAPRLIWSFGRRHDLCKDNPCEADFQGMAARTCKAPRKLRIGQAAG